MQTLLYTIHFIVCFILIGVVLLQRGKGADLGASLGGGGANTIFGSRGAGNFLTRMTTASAIIFMATSLTLSYYGYKASDVQLFDETEPFAVPAPGEAGEAEDAGGLEEVPSGGSESGGLVEIPQPAAEAPAGAEGTESGVDASTDASGTDASDSAP
ncbi:MAG TPA: preprotein translocase subunit SecG [Myxococcota bacterium]|nr:preprotein translocase subunit SecG [Myxococcota bacterium]